MSRGSLKLLDVDVTFNRGAADEHQALKQLNLTLEPGEYVTVIGPNGAGKSTLMNTIAGTVPATTGKVILDGQDLTLQPEHVRGASVARVMQDPRLNTCSDLTIAENLAFAERRGRTRSPVRRGVSSQRLEHSLDLLREHGRGLDRRLDEMAGKLSGGQRQVLAMVMAVANPPSVLMLDEHTSALDPEIAERVQTLTDQVVRAVNVTTLMITHNMRQALEYGDRLVIMSQGRVVDDISGEGKSRMSESQLIERFRAVVAESVSDRLIS